MRHKGKRLKKYKHFKNQKEYERFKANKKIEKGFSFMKFAVLFILINSELQIWNSYILAYLGNIAIAEALSQQIVVTIIGTIIAYAIKSLVENLSKYNKFFNGETYCEDEECYKKDTENYENNEDGIDLSQYSEMCDGINVTDNFYSENDDN